MAAAEALYRHGDFYSDDRIFSGLLDRLAKNGDDGVHPTSFVLRSVFSEVCSRFEGAGIDSFGQANTLAATLERLKEEGLIDCEADIDTAEQWAGQGQKEEHSWVRIEDAEGVVFIADPVKGIMGELGELRAANFDYPYLRDGDERDSRASRHARFVLDRIIGMDRREGEVDGDALKLSGSDITLIQAVAACYPAVSQVDTSSIE